MAYRRKYKRRRRSMNLATPKLATRVGIWQNPGVFLTTGQFPKVYYQRWVMAAPYTAERIMGIKITATPNLELKVTQGNLKTMMVGIGLFKATAVEVAAFGPASFQQGDATGEQVFRRVFARESTIEKIVGPPGGSSQSFAQSGAAFTSLIQRRVKGHVDLDNGQALYLASWYQAPVALQSGEQVHLAAHIEYSYTTRDYNAGISS